jgi:murein DD-endopeptidase MepM/ murein hydrolase activator NlpD
MKRLVVTAVAVLALAAGSASADTFEIVEPTFEIVEPVPVGPLVLPSAEVPNVEGSLFLPPNVFEEQFGMTQQLTYEELQALWQRAGAAYGIRWQILAAINKIETNFGRNMGPSSAGAVGWMQFMPDTWLRWGVDGSGDGLADPWNPVDAIFAAARYLAATGGRVDVARAIFAYNRAQWYVDDVLELAALLGDGSLGIDVVFTLDRLGLALEEAQSAVARLSEELGPAEEREREAMAAAAAATERGEAQTLLSDQLTAEQEAFQVDWLRAEATNEVERLREELAAAEAELELARDRAHASSFAPVAAGLLAAPTRADGYVFPVGGGPSAVSVGRDHHDYPAADIAAPHGAPVYALADAMVLQPVDDDRCGIGLMLRTRDGLVWIYCHLSYLDGEIESGTLLAAGQWVGLVGSTGRSTGPHLHLALKPELQFPQEMPWFQEFAALAFRWQDAPTVSFGPVFAVFPAAPEPAQDVIEFTLAKE